MVFYAVVEGIRAAEQFMRDIVGYATNVYGFRCDGVTCRVHLEAYDHDSMRSIRQIARPQKIRFEKP